MSVVTYGDRAFRRATAPLRHYPGFLIIGGIRCGTTSLIRYLGEHPEVAIASTKEPHFFDWNFGRGDNWYRSFFPLRVAGRHLVVGESSPAYLMDTRAPARSAASMPEARLLLLVRDPVERAHSHYRYRYERGHEPAATFEEALALEEERLKQAVASGRGQSLLSGYFHHGLYETGLSRWLEHFDRSQIMTIASEDFYADTSGVFARILRFLGLTNYELDHYAVHNAAASATMDPVTRASLVDRYREPNERLYELIGVDLGWAR
ncbi:MAG: sulfotransferase [Acidimicrobiia bacterium]